MEVTEFQQENGLQNSSKLANGLSAARRARLSLRRPMRVVSITEIQNLLSNSKLRNVIHSGRITFRVLTNYIPRLGELQSAVMANYNPRSQARPTP
jgi:hypothetical protein